MPMGHHAPQEHVEGASARRRLALFDMLRGFSVLSMVAFHLCYDLRFVFGQPLDWFAPPLQDIWRATISWTFLAVAGCMCSLSHNNLTRSMRYLGAAAAVYLITQAASVDTPISFGIIFCMGASTLIYWILDACGYAPKGWPAAVCLLAAFVACLGVPRGTIWVGSFATPLPRSLYSQRWLAFVGLPGPGFASGDYYPLIPYTLMYLTGAAAAATWRDKGFPALFSKLGCRPLEFVGRHALSIYLFHQPILLALASLVIHAIGS